MIVSAKRKNSDAIVDVVIDPFSVLCDISTDWRCSIGVTADSVIMGGYWMYVDHVDNTYTRIRLATRDEIVRFESIKNVTELTAKFYE